MGSPQYTNPLLATNSPDPAVTRLVDGSGFLLVTTSDHANKSHNSHVFPMYFSKGWLKSLADLYNMFLISDLISWELKSHVFHSSNWPRWAVDRFYAPEVHVVSGRYILYYTAGDRTGRLSCGAAVATSADPFGKFKVGDPPRVSQAPTVINSGPW